MLAALLLLAVLAVGMAGVTAVLIKWASKARTLVAGGIVLFLLGMMVAMLAGAWVYYYAPSGGTLVEGLWLASAAMSVSVFPIFVLILRDVQRRVASGNAYRPSPLDRRAGYAVSVIVLVLGNEFLMGWTFQLASGGPRAPALGAWAGALAYAVNSPWFLLPMAVEMALSAYLLRRARPTTVRAVLGLQAAMMAFSPPLSSDLDWVALSVVANSAIMFAVFLPPMVQIYRREPVPPRLMLYLMALLPIFGAMLVGIALWVVDGSGGLFAASVLAQMAVYFFAVILSDRFTAPGSASPQAA